MTTAESERRECEYHARGSQDAYMPSIEGTDVIIDLIMYGNTDIYICESHL